MDTSGSGRRGSSDESEEEYAWVEIPVRRSSPYSARGDPSGDEHSIKVHAWTLGAKAFIVLCIFLVDALSLVGEALLIGPTYCR